MIFPNAQSKTFLLAAMFVGLATVPSMSGDAKSWQDETVLVGKQGDQTVVKGMNGEQVLFKNKDAQLAIEWAMGNARTTVVLAGKYMVDDSIDAPRDGVTLIIDQGAVIEMNLDADPKTNLGFRSRTGPMSQQLVPMIYIKDRNHVRVYCFGDLVHGQKKKPEGSVPSSVQTFPIVFDGRGDIPMPLPDRNTRMGKVEDRKYGIDGGTLVATGSCVGTFFLCLDAINMQVPLVCPVPAGGDAVFCMEGCDRGVIGMVANLAKEKGGQGGETVDLNAACGNISFETLIGERSIEILDCNASQAVIKEAVSVGRPNVLFTLTPNHGARWTQSPCIPQRLTCERLTILADEDAAKLGIIRQRNRKNKLAESVTLGDPKEAGAMELKDIKIDKLQFFAEPVDVKRTIIVPKLPEALPRFTVKATVEVTLNDGSKKDYTKEVVIDVSQ
jgi:hypothetical protein